MQDSLGGSSKGSQELKSQLGKFGRLELSLQKLAIHRIYKNLLDTFLHGRGSNDETKHRMMRLAVTTGPQDDLR